MGASRGGGGACPGLSRGHGQAAAAAAAAAAACARRAHPACLNQEGGGGGGVDGEEAWPGEGVDGPAHAGPKAARLPPVGGEHREGSGM